MENMDGLGPMENELYESYVRVLKNIGHPHEKMYKIAPVECGYGGACLCVPYNFSSYMTQEQIEKLQVAIEKGIIDQPYMCLHEKRNCYISCDESDKNIYYQYYDESKKQILYATYDDFPVHKMYPYRKSKCKYNKYISKTQEKQILKDVNKGIIHECLIKGELCKNMW